MNWWAHQSAVVDDGAQIGAVSKVWHFAQVSVGARIGAHCSHGPGVVFTNVLNPRAAVPRKHEYRRTLVRRGATLGANCTLVCGHTIGAWPSAAPAQGAA